MKEFVLRPWQREFVDQLVLRNSHSSLLVAPLGSGKTLMSLVAAQRSVAAGHAQSILVVSDRRVLVDQWRSVSDDMGQYLVDGEGLLGRQIGAGYAVSLQSLKSSPMLDALQVYASERTLFTIIDTAGTSIRTARESIEDALGREAKHKILYTTSIAPTELEWDFIHTVDHSVFSGAKILSAPANCSWLKSLSSSYGVLEKIIRGVVDLDGLTWREFEKLIADLLVADGFTVTLMRGTKDGGVDVLAEKDTGMAGMVKTLWQAKKFSRGKVGLSTIRELADVGRDFGASKSILATTSFLTKGALERVERDRFVLGKFDRADLEAWIARYFSDNHLGGGDAGPARQLIN